jgi:hypothetical protein
MRKRVLVFFRPYLVCDFRENIKSLCDEFDFHLLADSRCDGVTDTLTRFYSRLDSAKWLVDFSEAGENDVDGRFDFC